MRNRLVFLLLFVSLVLMSLVALCIGSVNIPIDGFRDVLLGRESVYSKVILNIRLPRILSSLMLGGALSVSGFLLQTFFSNPIAGPYVLGISSGAKFTVALTMIFILSLGKVISSWALITSAFIGSLCSLFFVLLISSKVHNMSYLVVCGIMISYICSSLTDFVITFASDSNIVNLHSWSLGSFSGVSWKEVRIIFLLVTVTMVFTILMSKQVGSYLMGEDYARSVGVNIKTLRIALIILSSLLSSSVTAFAGPISFVGIAVPHLMRSLSSTSKPLILIPLCFMGGSLITLFCDTISRTLFSPQELSISTVTSLLLAPVVIYMMIRRRREAL